MLGVAFVRTADFDMLASGPTHNFVIGRRGAGKSALFLQLVAEFQKRPDNIVVPLRPEEFAIKGLIASMRARLPGDISYANVRSVTKVMWRAVLLAHVGRIASRRYRERDTTALANCVQQRAWLRKDPIASAYALLNFILRDADPDQVVYKLAKESGIEALEDAVRRWCGDNGIKPIVLVDGLDEGWRAQELEVGLVGGLCAAAVDLRDRSTNTHVLIFLRDNIFRILGERDDDFSRNIAGDNLRLTWDHQSLFDLVVRRLAAVFKGPKGDSRIAPTSESRIQTWNRFAKRDLAGVDGFAECLKHTLYRPRDVLELLNAALQTARRSGRNEVVASDISSSALDISKWRLNDLYKEYEEVLPGLRSFVECFSGRPAIDSLESVHALFEKQRSSLESRAKLTFAKLGTASNIVQSLFGVGFLGFEVTGAGFRFCHDGTDIASKELDKKTRVAVHPCYARALGVHLAENGAFDVLLAVTDEYDEVRSNKNDLANLVASASRELVGRLATIQTGTAGASDFEKWSRDVLEVLFAEDLANFELHPNKTAPLRRDVVAANEARSGVWRRMLTSYAAAQVVFEVKNFESLDPIHFQQARAYMGGPFGRLAFIVYRSTRDTLDDNERSHLQAHYVLGQNLLVLLPVDLVQRCLQKMLQNADAAYVRRKIGKWIDKHERVYIHPRAGAKS